MNKCLKWVSLVIIFVMAMLFFVSILLNAFVSPDRFKPMLVQKAEQLTGRKVTIGEMSWNFYPHFGLKISQLQIDNPDYSKERIFASIDHVVIAVKLIPLLLKEVKLIVTADSVQLNLIKSNQYGDNWKFNKKHISEQPNQNTSSLKSSSVARPTGDSRATVEHKQTPSKNFNYLDLLSSIEVDLENVNINFQDNDKAAISHHLNGIEILATDIQKPGHFPISIELDYSPRQSFEKYHVAVNSNVALQREAKIVDLQNLAFHIQGLREGKETVANFAGNLNVDIANQKLNCQDIKGNIANLLIGGMLNVVKLDNGALATGEILLSVDDVGQFLRSIQGAQTRRTSLRDVKNISGQARFAWGPDNKNVQAELKVDELQFNKMLLSRVALQVSYDNQLVHLYSATARLNGGELQAEAVANFRLPSMPISLSLTLDRVLVRLPNKLIDTDGHSIDLNGITSADVKLRTEGRNKAAMLKNLNGNIYLSVDNGKRVGIDLNHLINNRLI